MRRWLPWGHRFVRSCYVCPTDGVSLDDEKLELLDLLLLELPEDDPELDAEALGPVVPHPERSRTVVRIFDLYITGRYTLKSLASQLAAEGHVYQASQPRFTRTSVAYILNNRFYIGELERNGQVHEGRYQKLVDRVTFDTAQQVLHGRNRRTGAPNIPLSGGLFRCALCGQSMTGELIRRKLKGGGVREHVYYRCGNNNRSENHPTVRWKAADMEDAVVGDLATFQMPSPEIADWFREALSAAFDDLDSHHERQVSSLRKRRTELANMQDRLLNAYLAGSVPEETYKTKQDDLLTEVRTVESSLDGVGQADPQRGRAAVAIFDWTQNAAEIWRGSNNDDRRAILESVCLNRAVGPVSLALTKKKPFDILAEGPFLKKSGPYWI
jgi:site-specific DNA recombinase